MKRIPVGLQLYSVREDCAKDLEGTIAAVGKMGYEGVEFFAELPRPAAELRALIDAAGLKCCGWHMPFDLLQPDRIQGAIATLKTLGSSYTTVPWLSPEALADKAECLKLAALFTDAAATLAPHGITLGYHNHDQEFRGAPGTELPFDTFFGNTSAAVGIQMDTGNAMHGGADPLAFMRKYPGRSKTVHLKPYSKEAAAAGKDGFEPVIGKDSTDWKAMLGWLEAEGGTEWYIIEYECSSVPALEAVDSCLKALKAVRGE